MGAVGVESTSSQKGDTIPSFYDQDRSSEGFKKAIVEFDNLRWMKALHLAKRKRINIYYPILFEFLSIGQLYLMDSLFIWWCCESFFSCSTCNSVASSSSS